ncbi:hypothetical protein C8R41DRAFT_921661 [Lentinula lateritia]|uniref:Uncharacterized protein n=1 Tax=Lentinula lateritia TaxID=40482 RepID=A0ABQ8VEJ0_9AGAR|nr:hypothetical protein C8R41DRAFT_921661 [Lentinula lateritia]
MEEESDAPIITTKAYKGVLAAINEHSLAVDMLDNLEEVQDNITIELPRSTLDADEEDDEDDTTESLMDLSDLMKSIKEVSKGVSEKTSKEYIQLMKQCENFVHSRKMVAAGSPFFCKDPYPHAAEYLAACDEINLDGSEKDKSKERSTFTHAQKMRAAATFGFGQIHGLGMLAWHRSEYTGKMLGNPSVSETLTSYMLSLRQRKTFVGETTTSARAVTSALLLELYNFNNHPEFSEPRPYKPAARNAPKNPMFWGGCRARSLLYLGYTLAFCDLLWIDELLKIQVHDIEMDENLETGATTLTLTLPFRKTSQFGGT